MDIFNKLGRSVERFKQSAETAAESDPAYECGSCEARFPTEYDECPECGSEGTVSRTDSE